MTLKTFKFIFIVALLFTLNSCKGQTENSIDRKTQTFNAKEFKVDFPKTKNEIEVKENTATTSGKGYVNVWSLKGADEHGPFVFEIFESPITEERIAEIKKVPNTLNVIFIATLMRFSDRFEGADFTSNEVKIDGYSGMQGISKVFARGGLIKSVIFRKDDKIYMVSAGGKGMKLNDTDKFINSFRFNK